MRRLLALPFVAALAVGPALLEAGRAAGADAGPDPYGYVVDVDALDDPAVIAAGQELFATGCVTCHGAEGQGLVGPDIRDAGSAGAHFWLTTGRMPMANAEGQAVRKEPAYDPEEIQALVAYVASLGSGPAIPTIDLTTASLQHGGELFRLNCAACHQAAGGGGALSYGRNAPSLTEATAVQIAEAVRIGPGEMPVFGEAQLSDEEVQDVVRYVRYLQEADNPGGFSLGRIGPIPEGFVAIGIGLGGAALAAFLIGKRTPRAA
jgi:ubiquinol-cytochrome c reductase cytochrome c subunit